MKKGMNEFSADNPSAHALVCLYTVDMWSYITFCTVPQSETLLTDFCTKDCKISAEMDFKILHFYV